jgi:Ca-activated chloride channel family protein
VNRAAFLGKAKVTVDRMLASCLMAALLLAVGYVTCWAQQGGYQNYPNLPPPAGQGGTNAPPGTLEIPTRQGNYPPSTAVIPPQSPQRGSTDVIPPQAPQGTSELQIPAHELRRQPGYAQVTVTVMNQDGGYVTGLQKQDFTVYEDGIQRPVEFFRRDLNVPVSIGILVDTSGSMEPKLAQARLAISQFLRDLNPQDDVFLFAFSNRPFLLQPFTTDHALVMARLSLLHAFGRTALYDVILDGLLMVERGRHEKKALLVITDGMDNASMYSLSQVVSQARRLGVLIYSIGIGNPNIGGSSPWASFLGPLGFVGALDYDRVDAATLETLSRETGARTFIIRAVGDGAQLRLATQTISTELRQQYTIGFLSPDPERGGYRRLRVEVNDRPGVRVRVREGVTVGAGAPTYPPS